MGDCEIGVRADICVYKFRTEHFELNSYNKMRVFLAMHICSQTMIRMIRDYFELHEDGDTEEWDTVIEVLEKIDRTVDIINCRLDRGVDYIDCPQHKHIYELFSVLQLFEEWKENTGEFTFEFITRQTYEDLQWMVFGIAGVVCRY